MISKNKNLFLKIYILFVIIISIALIILQILGSKNRIGYLTDFNLNIERMLNLYDLENIIEDFTVDGKLDEESVKNYLLTNENITNYIYHFRIRYYDKVFRNNDIYGVYPDLSNLPDYMENAEMDEGGSPYGYFISYRETIEIETELTIYALQMRLPIDEVSAKYIKRPEGSHSKLNTFKDGFRILFTIIYLLITEKPLLFFNTISLIFLGIGLFLGIVITIEYFETLKVDRFPTAILTICLIILSALSFSIGLLMKAISKVLSENRRFKYNSVK